MAKERTVSRHFLRRTARERERELRRAQGVVMHAEAGLGAYSAATKKLRAAKINAKTELAVRSAIRGPFGWRVVAL